MEVYNADGTLNVPALNSSIQNFYDFLLGFIGKKAKKADKEEILLKIKALHDVIINNSEQMQLFADHLLICFCLLLVPSMDYDIRLPVWEVVSKIASLCVRNDISLLSWKQTFNTAFALPNDEITQPLLQIGNHTDVTDDLVIRQCGKLVHIFESVLKLNSVPRPEIKKELVFRWFNFLAVNIFPQFFVAGKNKKIQVKHYISVIFIGHLSKFINVDKGIFPFIVDENGGMTIANYFSQMLRFIVDYPQKQNEKEKININSIISIFIQKSLPCVITCRADNALLLHGQQSNAFINQPIPNSNDEDGNDSGDENISPIPTPPNSPGSSLGQVSSGFPMPGSSPGSPMYFNTYSFPSPPQNPNIGSPPSLPKPTTQHSEVPQQSTQTLQPNRSATAQTSNSSSYHSQNTSSTYAESLFSHELSLVIPAEFTLNLGQLYKRGVPFTELLSWFDASLSEPVINYINEIVMKSKNAQEFFISLILPVYHSIEPATELLSDIIASHQPFIVPISNLFVLMLTVRSITRYILKTTIVDQIASQLPNFFLTIEKPDLLPISICTYASILYETKKFDIEQVQNQMRGIKAKMHSMKNDALTTQLLISIARQIAIALSEEILPVLPECVSRIRSNPVSLERELYKTSIQKNKENDNNVYFFYSLSADGMKSEEKINFILDFLKSFDPSANYQLAPAMIDAMNKIIFNLVDKIPDVFKAILKYMLSNYSLVLPQYMTNYAECVRGLIKYNDSSVLMNGNIRIEWIKMLSSFISMAEEKDKLQLTDIALEEFLSGRQLSFVLLPLILFMASDLLEKVQPNQIEKLTNFFTMVSLMPPVISNEKLIKFYQLNMPDFYNKMKSFLSGSVSLPHISTQKLFCSLPIIQDAVPFFISNILCLLIKQLLIDDSVDEELVAMLSSFATKPENITSSFMSLISILPFFYDKIIAKKKNLLDEVIKILENYINLKEYDPKTYGLAIQTVADLMLVIGDDNVSTLRQCIALFFTDSGDPYLNSIIEREGHYFLDNFYKNKGLVKKDESKDRYTFNIAPSFVVSTSFDKDNFALGFGNEFSSSRYEVSVLNERRNMETKSEEMKQGIINTMALQSPGATLMLDIMESLMGNKLPMCQVTTDPDILSSKLDANIIPVTLFFTKDNDLHIHETIVWDMQETSLIFRSFLKSIGKYIDGKSLPLPAHNNKYDGPILFWETWRFSVIYNVVPLLKEKKREIYHNDKIVIIWSEQRKSSPIASDFHQLVPKGKIFIIITPIRNNICRVTVKAPADVEVGPLRSELLVPSNIIGPLIQWTIVVSNNVC